MRFFLRVLLTIMVLLPASETIAATYYWVGGNGTWTNLSNWSLSSGGTVHPTTIPSPSDNIVIDNNSSTTPNLGINFSLAVISFNTMSCTDPSLNVNFSGGSLLKIYGGLQLTPNVNFAGLYTFDFESQTTGNIISLHSLINIINFQGNGGAWELGANLRANTINFNLGSLSTAGYKIECNSFLSQQNNSRILNLSSSLIEVQNWTIGGTGITINAGTSLIDAQYLSHLGNANYYDATIGMGLAGDTLVFHDVTALTSNATFNGEITYNKLELGGTNQYSFYGKHTFLVSLTANGTNCSKRLKLTGYPTSATFVKTSGTLTVSNAEIQNIQATGGAVYTTINCFDKGGNSGWFFPVPTARTLYWVGGSGSWTDPAHWSLSSNGPGGECIPTMLDDVFFDSASFTPPNPAFNTMEFDSTISRCKNLTWNIPYPVNVEQAMNISFPVLLVYGSLKWDKEISWGTSIDVEFLATTTGNTITCDGNSFPSSIRFSGIGGEWTMMDDLIADSVSHYSGIFRTNGYKMAVVQYTSSLNTPRSLFLYNSLIELRDASIFHIAGSNHTQVSGTSTLRFLEPGRMWIQYITPLAFYHIEFVSGYGNSGFRNAAINTYIKTSFNTDCEFEGTFSSNHITLYGNHTYKLTAGMVMKVVDSLEFLSNCQKPMFISSITDSAACFIEKLSGIVQGQRLILKDVYTLGAAVFNALQSVDLGNNTGWTFVPHAGNNLYWVNGTGKWDDSNHWSFSSGGASGACIPTPVDNVFFDNNSFLQNADTVKLDIANAFCLSMHWNVGAKNPVFRGSAISNLWIYGSLKLDTNMVFSNGALTHFMSTQTGRTIESAGKIFTRAVYFEGHGGEWLLVDSMTVNSKVFHEKGTLRFQKNTFSCGSYYSASQNYRMLDMRSAIFRLKVDPQTNSVDFKVQNGDFKLRADSSELISSLGAPQFILGTADSLKFWNVYFLSNGDNARIESNGINTSFFRRIFSRCGSLFLGPNHFDTLELAGPATFRFSNLIPQKIKKLITVSDCNKRISFVSAQPPGTGLIFNTTGNLVNDCDVNNVIIQGGGTFTAQNSSSQGTTTGWVIVPKPPLNLYWVNGSGNWTNPYHWSTTSGGAGNGCIPTAEDNVFFDQNSFIGPSDTVLLNSLGYCHNMTWGGYQSNPLFLSYSATVFIHGSMIFDSLMNTKNINVSFQSNNTGKTVASFFKPLDQVSFNGAGSWNITRGLNCMSINHVKGGVNTLSTRIDANQFLSSGNQARSLNLGSSICNIKATWILNGQNLTFNSGTSQIFMNSQQMTFSSAGANLSYFNLNFNGATSLANLSTNGNNSSFNKVFFEGSAIIIGEHFFDSLLFSPGNSYQLDIAKSQTIKKYWLVRGNNCYPINLRSTTLGSQATVLKSGGSVSGDFIHMRDIKASGGATFYAGANSSNTSNNQGWIFQNQPGYNYGLGNDTLVCSFYPFVLSTANFNGGKWFQWSDGSTASTLNVSQSGTYWVRVYYSNDCYVSDTIKITYFTPLAVNFGPDTSICEGDTLTLTVNGPVNSFQWSTGSSAPQLNVSQSGTYAVTITDLNACTNSDTIKVNVIGLPRPNLGKDTHICLDDSMLLDAGNFYTYNWSNNATQRYIVVHNEGLYWVEVTGQCGSGSDTIRLQLLDCDFFVPNVFTPNGDGINDRFEIVSKDLSKYHLCVYNRWGAKIFCTSDLNTQWDGTYKGENCSDGVYFWVAEYERKSGFGFSNSFKAQGSVTIMR